MVLIKLLLLMCALANSSAFSISSHGKFLMYNNGRQTKLYETSPESQSESNDETPSIPAAEMIPFAEDREIEVSVSYPIPLPSPVLLGSAMVLGIASIGSIFELTGAEPPQYGFVPTAAIAVIGLPSCLYLFYASILKAQAETEEDDKRYMQGR
mmetsp:Transcript_27549/g.41686  ORF Transcript_27549/g.41686 Transcript_27549/m.41686 type:complete len:154 (+) Transcript_27549:126-587(+)|eukprot:CAMPEP_0178921554 /NCGR_PEP_ID=MMETSP0786-20121207/15630_1 /TAXON_ID=186022 /ORGANISM="Thalassionema frauenfeldii, Strain CCMP 1798" /LENGTH=153 /DNA_ID=CAMNT_0020595755 /DNA_START=80 /DNA_END=541 /DNA_ORIENTATION=+